MCRYRRIAHALRIYDGLKTLANKAAKKNPHLGGVCVWDAVTQEDRSALCKVEGPFERSRQGSVPNSRDSDDRPDGLLGILQRLVDGLLHRAQDVRPFRKEGADVDAAHGEETPRHG
jgi:hypothetical protein